MATSKQRPYCIRVALSDGEAAALNKKRGGTPASEYIRRLIMTEPGPTDIDPKYVTELENENACLARANAEVREKLQNVESKMAAIAKDAEQLQYNLAIKTEDCENLELDLRQANYDLCEARARAGAYEVCLASAQLIPARPMKGDR